MKLRDAKMMDMAEKAEKGDKKDSIPELVGTSTKSKGPSYPWGLKITLNKDQLSKMKIDPKDLTVGDKVDISALAKVVRIEESADTYNNSKSVELQITKLSVV